MTTLDEVRRHLTIGLVGDRQHLYATSPTFKVGIDGLVGMLPLWVDGIAAHAEEYDEKLKQAIAAAEKNPPRGLGLITP